MCIDNFLKDLFQLFLSYVEINFQLQLIAWNGTVYEAQIDKKHIYAYFGGRNESEVIVDPSYLTNITEVQDMSSDFLLSQE